MLLKVIAITLVLCISVPTMTAALPDAPSESKRIEDTKKNIDEMRNLAHSFQRSGKAATVTLNDKAKRKGQITTVTENGFLLRKRDGQEQQLSFTDVQNIRKSGMRTGAKVAIGVGLGFLGYVGILCATGRCVDD